MQGYSQQIQKPTFNHLWKLAAEPCTLRDSSVSFRFTAHGAVAARGQFKEYPQIVCKARKLIWSSEVKAAQSGNKREYENDKQQIVK